MSISPDNTIIRKNCPNSASCHLSADALAQLEQLDDTIFEAINGDADALNAAAKAWRRALATLDEEAIEESREQYLRRAETVWQRLKNEPGHAPQITFAALEIISMLCEEN